MILQKPIAFVDVETTGFDPINNEIIELACVIAKVKDESFVVIDQLDIKIQPTNIASADPQALRVNGYNETDWLFAVSLEDAMKSFASKTQGAIFTAHNVAFDYMFINEAFRKTGIENTMHYHKLDTISIALAVLHNSESDISKFSLKALCEHYGIENKKAHSAFSDAYATYELFKKLLNLK